MQAPTVIFNPTNFRFPPNSSIFPSKLPSFLPKKRNFVGRSSLHQPRMDFLSGFRVSSQMGGGSSGGENGFCTLMDYVGKGRANVGDDLVVVFGHLQYACKRIAALVASPFNSSLSKNTGFAGGSGSSVSGRDAQKPLDIVSNEIILSSLQNSGKVAVFASEEDDAPVWIADDGPFVVVTDPLDGSRNIDASIPTGTIFGIYNRCVELDHLPVEEKAMLNSLQSGSRLVAAGYVLYSSATILCTSFGSGTHAFTLDHSTGDFILTHPNIKIPPRGQIYSVNDARYFDWPEGLRRYIDNVRQGKGKYPKKYSARYICSLVADFHRTLMYGGVAMNPRDHLRLVYEANPLSFLVEQAGGRGSDGKSRILSIQPVKLHQRLPLFLGSLDDMEELESYGDVQQKVNPGYEV
uniref:fructose-bisphosphatase n=1 Tax=Davidia involucrata TaxID=16924 RepID=A0A5B7BYS6_DAVIN